MHHFGCVVPNYESLEIIRQVAGGKPILDIGSGNGYWTFMLRRGAKPGGGKVVAVDSGQSVYRTLWIGDTVVADGIKWLREERKGGVGDVLLLVYPIVGGDGFTEKVIKAYKGDAVCVVGTQCRNGYTAFRDKVIDQWMEEEGGWEKIVQVPVPSFAGKDEALFVFRKSGGLK
jgi:SAM-dependent methyltransferase